MRHARMGWFHRGVWALLLGALCLGSVAWSAGITGDSFSGTELKSGWTVYDPDKDDTVTLTGDGWLQVVLGTNEDSWENNRGGAVFILTDSPKGSTFVLETHINMAAGGVFMDHFIGGLVIVDDGNTEQYPFEVSLGLHHNGGNKEVTLQRPGTTLAVTAVDCDAAFLRLERDGAGNWNALYKVGKNDSWILIGTATDADLAGGGIAGDLSVGLFCKTWGSAAAATAAFDYYGSPEPKADEPSPARAEEDVLRDVVLSWVSGEGATTHTVYFGTSYDDVNDATLSHSLNVLVSEEQSDNTYDPEGLLEFGLTYYWRVDENNGSDNSTVKGEVWTFTVEPEGYPIAAGAIAATASSVNSEAEGPEGTIDGSGLSDADLHSAQRADMWLSSDDDAGKPWIQLAFDRTYRLHEMRVWNHNSEFEWLIGLGIKEATIEYSVDGVTWTTLGQTHEFAQASSEAGYASNTTIDLGGVVAGFVKITALSNWGGFFSLYGLSEVRFYHLPMRAYMADPASGATEVDVQEPLTWRAGREAVVHDVYLSTDEQAVIDGTAAVTTLPEAGYSTTLDLSTTYYWRIDEVNEAADPSVWEGSVWSFTTADYITVDNFENYTDSTGSQIFEFWIDGYTTKASGSTVGYMDAPFAEQTIVHKGFQSMPLFYDNTNFSSSEAALTIDQDWTLNGVKYLVLYYAGAETNSSGQLYVKINDAQVLYAGEGADLLSTDWTAWTIDLSTVGTTLNDVKTLTVGVSGAGAIGVVYIDDIRLCHQAP